MIVYKALRSDGRSQYQSTLWPLPQDGVPGDWMEVDDDRPIGLCTWGLHGYLTEDIAAGQPGTPCVYEMELLDKDDGDAGVKKDGEKACGYKARLLRLIRDENGPVIQLAELVWQ